MLGFTIFVGETETLLGPVGTILLYLVLRGPENRSLHIGLPLQQYILRLVLQKVGCKSKIMQSVVLALQQWCAVIIRTMEE